MKAKFEKIEPGFGSSFALKEFRNNDFCNRSSWHFHPEYEIVYISNGKGKRHIGNHISQFENGDLIFLGPDLPHFGFTEQMTEQHTEIVIQMKKSFLGDDFLSKPEFFQIAQLFQRSHLGLSFFGKTKEKAGDILLQMAKQQGFERLISLLELLHFLATSEDYQTLNATNYAFEVNAQDYPRINAIYQYVDQHFKEHISLDEVAKLINMTPPAFSRYFKKLTGKTFVQFVNEYRIAYASKQLGEEDQMITDISFESGFNNISHFNKQFKLITGLTPSEYRSNLKKVVQK